MYIYLDIDANNFNNKKCLNYELHASMKVPLKVGKLYQPGNLVLAIITLSKISTGW